MQTTTKRRTIQTALLLLAVANFALTVDAGPIGDAALSISKFYWILVLFCLLILAIIVSLEKRKSPIDIIGLTYDKNTHKLELTVRNNDASNYCIKSALRLVKPAVDAVNENVEDGLVMSSANSISDRRTFDLLGEDNDAIIIAGNETKTLTYDVILPSDYINLEAENNVEVHISYGEDDREGLSILSGGSEGQIQDAEEGPSLQAEDASNLAESSIEEVNLIRELAQAIENSPQESVEFHMRYGNAIANWVNDVANDNQLASRIMSVNVEDASDLKKELLDILTDRLEAEKHPYLRKVDDANSFKLKTGPETTVKEVFLLEELVDVIENCPDEAIRFHTRDMNDFSNWIKECLGDQLLAEAIQEIQGSPEDVKKLLADTIKPRIEQLKDQNDSAPKTAKKT
ncbi:DUF5752 family protein [Candidatus Altiarchaeota archaeon]